MFSELIHDANRFILSHRSIIQKAPLQVYYSAVLFSPKTSIIRSLFSDSLTQWILRAPTVNNTWGTELMVIEGHEHMVLTVAISPDGKTIASGSFDGTARLWEAATGLEVAKMKMSNYIVWSVAFSLDGQTIALGLTEGLRLYDMRTGIISTLEGHTGLVEHVAFSPLPGSNLLASLSTDETLRLWDISRKTQVSIYDVPKSSGGVAFLPDGNRVAAGSGHDYASVCIWDVKTKELKAKFNHSSRILSIAFSPNGLTMASTTEKELTQVWDTELGTILVSLSLGECRSLAFSPDGGILAIGCQDGTISLRNSLNGEETCRLRHHTEFISDLAFSADGKAVLSASGDGTIRLCDITVSDETEVTEPERGTAHSISTITTNSGKAFALVRSNDGTTVMDLSEFGMSWQLPYQLECSPADKIVTSSGRSVKLWDITTGEQVIHFEDANKIYFSPYGGIIALIAKGAIQILEIEGWKEQARFEVQDNVQVSDVEFLKGNKVLLWKSLESHQSQKSNYSFSLGYLQSGHTVLQRQLEDGSSPATISADGQLVAYECERRLNLLEVDAQEVRARLPLENGFTLKTVSFSPNNARIAMLEDRDWHEWKITLWDTDTGKNLGTRQMGRGWFWLIGMTMDSKVAILGIGKIFLWDPVANELSDRLMRNPDMQRSVSFSEDRKYIDGCFGRVPLPSSAQDYSCLYMDYKWILQGGERILWLPRAYRSEHAAVQGGTIVLGLKSGSVDCIGIDLEKTPLVMQQKASTQVERDSLRITETE